MKLNSVISANLWMFAIAFFGAQLASVPNLSAQQINSNLLDCNIIFEQRKDEIRAELQAIDERQQAMQVLHNANQVLLSEKERKINQKEQEIDIKITEFNEFKQTSKAEFDAQLAQIRDEMARREAYLQNLIQQNEELLKAIKKQSDDRVVDSFRQMKEAKTAEIFAQMSEDEVVDILGKMNAKDVSKIMAKMDAQKAASITQKLLAPKGQKADNIPPITPAPEKSPMDGIVELPQDLDSENADSESLDSQNSENSESSDESAHLQNPKSKIFALDSENSKNLKISESKIKLAHFENLNSQISESSN